MSHVFPVEHWNNFVNSCLDENQKRLWQQFHDRRIESRIDTMAFLILGRFAANMVLDSKQQIAVHKMIVNTIKTQGLQTSIKPHSMFLNLRLLAKVDEQDYAAALGKKTYAIFERKGGKKKVWSILKTNFN